VSNSELLVIILFVLILFGGKRLPEFIRNWVKITRELRRNYMQLKRQIGLDDIDDIIKKDKR
jgi:Sec-independent protein translocase protein TatA